MDTYALRKVRKKHHAYIRYMNTLDGQAYQTYIRSRNKAIKQAKNLNENKNQTMQKVIRRPFGNTLAVKQKQNRELATC